MKIYLSAIETNEEHARAVHVAKARSLLTSYHYARSLQGVRKQVWMQALAQANARMIDSGAFSWQQEARKGRLITDHRQFFAEYLLWLKDVRKRGLADVWIELDIGAVVGMAWVHEHRKTLLRQGFGRGLIQVWHSAEYSWKDWEALISEAQDPGRSNYVAIEGNREERNPLDYDKFLTYAIKKGCRVHGFRLTSIKDNLLRYPFYSVDSTTWVSGVLYGTSLGRGLDGWLSLQKTAAPLWGNGQVPRHAKAHMRLDWLVGAAKGWVELERLVTQYWEKKGIKWAA